jgi:hypothetical protein
MACDDTLIVDYLKKTDDADLPSKRKKHQLGFLLIISNHATQDHLL